MRQAAGNRSLPAYGILKGMIDLEKTPDHILDIRRAIPPISLLKVSQIFRTMKEQETLEILCRDFDTRTDIFKVLPSFSYELIHMEEMEKEESSFRVQMKKRKNI